VARTLRTLKQALTMYRPSIQRNTLQMCEAGVMIRWTGLAPWEYKCPLSGRLTARVRKGAPSGERARRRSSTATCTVSGIRIQDSGFRVQGAGFRVQGSGFRVQGPGFRGQGSGSRVQGPGLRVEG